MLAFPIIFYFALEFTPLFKLYVGYMNKMDFSEGRTNPTIKYLLFFIYFVTTSFLLRNKFQFIPRLAYLRAIFFSVASASFFVLGLSELAARVMIYFLAFDVVCVMALYIQGRRMGLQYKFIWVITNIGSPSVLGLLALSRL